MKEFLFGINKNKVHFLVKTAILLALTISMQYLAGLFGQQLLTGSIVNMMLLVNTMFIGLIGSIFVGLCTPFIGFLIGMSNNIILVPFIALSNALYIVVFKLLMKLFKVKLDNKKVLTYIFQVVSVVLGAVIKFMFLYFIVLKGILPYLLPKIPAQLNIMFGVTQLFTALIGGTLFIVFSRMFILTNKNESN